jgi:hypothetical protein
LLSIGSFSLARRRSQSCTSACGASSRPPSFLASHQNHLCVPSPARTRHSRRRILLP